jgi:isopenicillin-N epimerase
MKVEALETTTGAFGRARLVDWPLEPGITYLNHGTVGVTPLRILAVQQEIRDQIERHPSRYLLRELAAVSVGPSGLSLPRLRAAAASVAVFCGARSDDLVFVDNATAGANAILRSFPFEPGDEILVTDLGYGGVTRAAVFAARQRGATVRTVTMSWPFRAADLADAYVSAVGPRTRLAIVDHITSESALICPLAAVAARLRERGVAVLADGAHAPAAIPLDIPALGVDWYVANLHKWAWTPRSCGILWARQEHQATLHPPVISWGLDEGFTREFDWVGTRDFSAWLAAPAALALLAGHGLDAVRAHNHAIAWNGAHRLAERFGTDFDVPESLIGTMATVPLPESMGSTADEALALRHALFSDHGIEVQLHAYRERLWVRISGQVYNDMEDVERLADAVIRRR